MTIIYDESFFCVASEGAGGHALRGLGGEWIRNSLGMKDIVVNGADPLLQVLPDTLSRSFCVKNRANLGSVSKDVHACKTAAPLFRICRQLSQSGSHRSSRLKTKPSSPGERINITTINTRFISHRMLFNYREQRNFHNERGSRANFGKVSRQAEKLEWQFDVKD